MQIKLNLVLSLIVEAVKAETYIKGSIDRAAGNDQHASNAVSFHETAGDESVHERKIIRGIYTSADKLRSLVQDYLDINGASIADNNSVSISESTDKIEFTLTVSDRYNKANSDALARLFSKYIEDNTLVLWWGAINQQQMAFYQSLLAEDVNAIQRLFIKTAPSAPVSTYTNSITTSGSTLSMLVGEKSSVTYSIDSSALDDVDAVSSDPFVAVCHRYGDKKVVVLAHHLGICTVKLFSRHNDSVKKEITVKVVTEED